MMPAFVTEHFPVTVDRDGPRRRLKVVVWMWAMPQSALRALRYFSGSMLCPRASMMHILEARIAKGFSALRAYFRGLSRITKSTL